jgi:thioredoxin reductase (NADPH)
MERWDAIIVGAGPAGLTAATYLARFRRPVLLLGDGPSRASWIPESHNTPGFPYGVGGPALLGLLARQAAQFGVESRDVRVDALTSRDGGFEALTSAGVLAARTVLLATGVLDRMPEVPGIETAVRASLVRMCPICDAFEAIGKRIAVLGQGPFAEREAEFLRRYSDDVSIIDPRAGDLGFNGDEISWTAADGSVDRFDHLYLALGCEPQSGLCTALGAARDGEGNLLVDAHQMTSIEGLYAAGDVVRGLNQIAVAAGEAAIAATAIHNRLRQMDA